MADRDGGVAEAWPVTAWATPKPTPPSAMTAAVAAISARRARWE
ncbi:hypothetical protein [Gordonia bronchialis]|nr:hypothetical protein [Gordonia bronchialis]